MKNKRRLFGIIAAAAAIGFSLAGCSSDDSCAEFGHCRFALSCYSSSCSVRQLVSADPETITDEQREAVSCNC